jgi:hypothetical protein
MKKINFITTGCSFTAGIIPLPHTDSDDWNERGSVWTHFCFAKTDTAHSKFVNLGLPAGGNIAAMSNLIYYLETNQTHLDKSNTIIGFNITELGRVDTIADSIDTRINRNLCCIDPSGLKHFSDEVGFGWITGLAVKKDYWSEKNYINSCLAVLQCLCYLELHNYQYFFMTMTDQIYTTAPTWFQQCLDSRKDKWITFDGAQSMLTLVKEQKMCKPDLHPSTQGQKLIAQYVLDFCYKKYGTQFFNQ